MLAGRELSLAEPPLGPLTVTLPAGRITILTGPSGSGKSRLLRILADLDLPAAGRVELEGRPAESYPAPEFRRRTAMLPASPLLGPGAVGDLVERVRTLPHRRAAGDPLPALRRLGLKEEILKQAASSLSTGETVRVALALLLSGDPEVLLLDEPTGALDPTATAAVEAWVRERAAAGLAVLWVTHDPEQAARVGDALYYLREGALRGPVTDSSRFAGIIRQLDPVGSPGGADAG